MLDLYRTPVPSFNEKSKKSGKAYLDRFPPPTKIAQAPEEASRKV